VYVRVCVDVCVMRVGARARVYTTSHCSCVSLGAGFGAISICCARDRSSLARKRRRGAPPRRVCKSTLRSRIYCCCKAAPRTAALCGWPVLLGRLSCACAATTPRGRGPEHIVQRRAEETFAYVQATHLHIVLPSLRLPAPPCKPGPEPARRPELGRPRASSL
jgi:hypothetical protein